ncbi:MAG: FAD-dependent oxidoreductase, partial [Myxococcaceae bacterium]|nr:FAD-dependent oxidoreductase [Myxococcaceae bacterium]
MTPEALRAGLEALLEPARVMTHPHALIARASDASFYRLVPKAVVLPRSVEEVQRLLAFARQVRLPLVFRGAGTSLSGQAVTDGILVDVSRYFRGFRVEDDGARVWVQPGVFGGRVNAALRPFGRRIGPDPASIDRCTLGGILANNASGMCCGVEENAYHTLERARLVLADGTEVDT